MSSQPKKKQKVKYRGHHADSTVWLFSHNLNQNWNVLEFPCVTWPPLLILRSSPSIPICCLKRPPWNIVRDCERCSSSDSRDWWEPLTPPFTCISWWGRPTKSSGRSSEIGNDDSDLHRPPNGAYIQLPIANPETHAVDTKSCWGEGGADGGLLNGLIYRKIGRYMRCDEDDCICFHLADYDGKSMHWSSTEVESIDPSWTDRRTVPTTRPLNFTVLANFRWKPRTRNSILSSSMQYK